MALFLVYTCISALFYSICFASKNSDLGSKFNYGVIKDNIDVSEFSKNFDEAFYKIKGQDVPKKKFKSIVVYILNQIDELSSNGPWFLHLKGGSGVGKKEMVKILYKIIADNKNMLNFGKSDFTENDNEASFRKNFEGYLGNKGGKPIYSKTRFLKYIDIVNKYRKYGFIFFDDIQQIWSQGLEAMFKSMIDKGYFIVNNTKYDCSRIFVVMTSKYGTQEDVCKDSTKSLVTVDMDTIFLNRIIDNTIIFNNLKKEDYSEIIKDIVVKIIDNYKNKINISYTDAFLDSLSDKIYKVNCGARPIFTYIKMLYNEIDDILIKYDIPLSINTEREIDSKFIIDKGINKALLDKKKKRVKEKLKKNKKNIKNKERNIKKKLKLNESLTDKEKMIDKIDDKIFNIVYNKDSDIICLDEFNNIGLMKDRNVIDDTIENEKQNSEKLDVKNEKDEEHEQKSIFSNIKEKVKEIVKKL